MYPGYLQEVSKHRKPKLARIGQSVEYSFQQNQQALGYVTKGRHVTESGYWPKLICLQSPDDPVKARLRGSVNFILSTSTEKMEEGKRSSQPCWESALEGRCLPIPGVGRTKKGLSWRLLQLMWKYQSVCCSGAAAGLYLYWELREGFVLKHNASWQGFR